MVRPFYVTRAGLLGTAAVLAVAAGCVRLGFWQLDRHRARHVHNAAIAGRLEAPAARLVAPPADTAGLLYRHVEIEGEYDDGHSIILGGRSFRGAPGVHVLTPLRPGQGGLAVLVNRGWLPSPDAAHVDLGTVREPGPVLVHGVAIPLPAGNGTGAALADSFVQQWSRLDAAALQRQSPYPLASFYLQALPAADAPTRPVRLPPPELDAGPHLGYAVQWFSFAVIGIVGWLFLARREERSRAPRAEIEA